MNALLPPARLLARTRENSAVVVSAGLTPATLTARIAIPQSERQKYLGSGAILNDSEKARGKLRVPKLCPRYAFVALFAFLAQLRINNLRSFNA
jgi:hypothetical protein